VTSSQRSSSSKRSLDDDGEPIRSSKRADRRKSTRRRADMSISISEPDRESSPRLPIESPNTDTPPSTQGTDISSDVPILQAEITEITAPKTTSITLEDEEAGLAKDIRPILKPKVKSQARTSLNIVTNRAPGPDASSPRLMSVAERPKSTLRA
jgi:hypothetical protein